MVSSRPSLVAFCATAVFFCFAAFGQSPPQQVAFLSGLVVDPQGGAISNAHLVLRSVVPGSTEETTSDVTGHFSFPHLTFREYRLDIQAKGFASFSRVVRADAGGGPEATYALAIASSRTTVDVVVTATRTARAITDVPLSVSALSSEDIEQTPARTIDDVLRRVPSVDLPFASTNEQHPTDTIVSMRGLSGIRSLVLLDGVPLNDPFFGFVQWSEVPLETVDQIEVVRGGGSTLWGNYAMGGVINILTKPVDKTELVVEAAGGSRDTYRSDGHAAFAGNWFGVGIDGGTSGSAGYIEQAKDSRGSIAVPTSYTADTAALSGDANITKNLAARIRVSHYNNAQNFLTHQQRNGEGTWRYTGALNWRIREGESLNWNGVHTDERFTTSNTGTPDGFDPTEAEYVQNMHRTSVHDWGSSLLWTKALTGVLRSVSAGGDYRGVRGSDSASIYDQASTYVRTDFGSGDQRFAGGFVQAELRPFGPLQILTSLRYQDFFSFHGRDDTPGGLGAAVPSRHDGDVDPRLSARYSFAGGLALRGAVYRAFRAPTLDNLYRAASVPGYILYGNAALRPETLNGGEVGFDLDKGPVRLQATLYDSHIANLLTYRYLPIDLLPTGFAIGARLINAGLARSRGFEAELQWRLPRHRLETVFGYTYADSVVTGNPEDPASVGIQQPGIPRNRVTLGAIWTTYHGIQVSPHIRYLARTNGDPDAIYRTDPHFVADLALAVPLSKSFECFVQMENLLDRRYIGTNDGFTAPLYGRPFTAVAGVRVRLR